jgi:periplasmic divalent cation tolerance protein
VNYVQIQFAIDDPVRADAIIESLVAESLVACGQRMGPVTSCYRWKGTLERSSEWLVLLKTRAELEAQVIDGVVSRHPYETPEAISLPIGAGALAYLSWIDDVTGVGSG